MDPVLALSVQDQLEQVGAYAGLAAIPGLAVLSLLYFAQAREVKRLREWAGRSPEHAEELEQQGAAEPAPGQPRAMPRPRPAAAAQSAPGATPSPPPAQPTAEAGETQAIAPPSGGPPGTAGDPRPATAPAGAAPGDGAASVAPAPDAEVDSDGAAPGPPAAAAPPSAAGPPPVPPGARPQPAGRPHPTAASARPRGGGSTQAPRAGGARPAQPATPSGSRRRGGLAPRYTALIVGGVFVLVAAGAFAVTRVLDDDGAPAASGPSAATATDDSRTTPEAAARENTTVTVLNGTTTAGLAAGVSDQIARAGFAKGQITNAADRQRSSTVVFFAQGSERQAREVARILEVDSVEPIDPGTAVVAGEESDVVVVVGADRTQ
jgi:hypothetical protein